jgi:hypothetical protein
VAQQGEAHRAAGGPGSQDRRIGDFTIRLTGNVDTYQYLLRTVLTEICQRNGTVSGR